MILFFHNGAYLPSDGPTFCLSLISKWPKIPIDKRKRNLKRKILQFPEEKEKCKIPYPSFEKRKNFLKVFIIMMMTCKSNLFPSLQNREESENYL